MRIETHVTKSFWGALVTVATGIGLVSAASASGNLLVNADLTEDNGIGLPLGWSTGLHPSEIGGGIAGRALTNGSFEVTTHGRTSRYFFAQKGLTLVPGGAYDLACDVRTTGLGGGLSRIYVRNGEWKSESQGFSVPDDTKDEWVRLEKRIIAEPTGRPSDYVLDIEEKPGSNGLARIEIRALSLVAAGETEREGSRSLPAAATVRLPARIVPVDPLLSRVDSKTGRMRFYWARSDCAGGGFTLTCSLDGRKDVRVPFAEDGYADLTLGALRPGEHAIALGVVGADGIVQATNDYRITAGRWKSPASVGRRLNNFVTELVNAPLADGDVAFERAEQGWTWISFDGANGEAKGYLDTCAEPVVLSREGEPTIETQRYLPEGRHVLHVVGAKGGRLRIHAIKTLWTSRLKYFSTRESDLNGYSGYHYALPFAQAFGFLSTFNTMCDAEQILAEPYGSEAGHYLGRGLRLDASCVFWPSDADRLDAEASYRHLARCLWPGYPSMTVNENLVRAGACASVNFSEAVWRLSAAEPRTAINVWYADSSWGAVFDSPRYHVSEIASIVNSGCGRGLLVPELYIPVTPTREGLAQYIDMVAALVNKSGRMVPASRGKVVLYGASYIRIGDFCNYYAPETDIKAQYAALMRAYATDPRFADCAGVGFGGLPCGEEEFRRWGVKLIRYYALEGGTEDLAEKWGFQWNPGFVKNPDFVSGFEGWTARASETNTLYTETIRHFGKRVEQRISPPGFGDSLATFRHSAKGPNILSQKLTGLTPGRYYSLLCAVVDRNTMTNTASFRWSQFPPFAFSVKLQGATEVRDLRSVNVVRCADNTVPKKLRNRTVLRNLRYVFRADSPEATLTFVDRFEDGSAAPEGWLSMNYVIFRPYYSEDGENGVRRVISALKGDRTHSVKQD